MISKFYKTHPDAILPTYGTSQSAGMDLYLIKDIYIYPGEKLLVSLGLIVVPPENYHFEIVLRSSTPLKYPGLILLNSIGIIDSDYCGPEDELKLSLGNIEERHGRCVEIPKHTRIAQMLLRPNIRTEIQEIKYEEIRSLQSRGGFGSTGR